VQITRHALEELRSERMAVSDVERRA
jgi:hypothetical protein